jgi:alpha-D-xyloside xylohydrolase
MLKTLVFYGPQTVHVNASLGHDYAMHPSIVIVAKPGNVRLATKESASVLNVSSPQLTLEIDKATAAITFRKPDGTIITREQSDGSWLKRRTIAHAPTYEVKQTFALSADESLYGLGQYNDPYMDYRGQKVLLVQTNIGIVVPMLLSTRRYGLLWDTYSKGTFEDDSTGASFWWESAPSGIDYYFIAGADSDDVIRGYRDLTGAAPLPPKSAFGLFMSKERYKTQQELIEVAKRFREAHFPLDYIVQDWQYWGGNDGTWSGMTWDKERYPNPRELTRTLHEDLHVKLMNSIWPSIGNDTELAHELDAKGLRFAPLHWISKQARVYDAFSREGREIYFKHIKRGLLDAGVDALWMDGTEVEVGGACHDPVEVEADIKGLGSNAMGDFTRYLNVYSLMTTKGTYEGQRATSNKRIFTLTRSAWAGQQRYAAVPWSGDTTASWTTLRNQIAGGINVAMAGLPYWTQDTGGFFVNFPDGERNPEYRELFTRWHQFAIFNPIYRIHGTNIEREPYVFKTLEPAVYASLLHAAQLRYRLLPYIYGLAWQSTANGYTLMRGLPMDFPDDHSARKIADEFTFGPAFLVHPITRAMYHVGNPPPVTVPTQVLRTPAGEPGVAVEYFADTSLKHSASKSIDARIEHTWAGPPLANPPAGLKDLNDFSARWQGFLLPPEDGEYEFTVEGDDGFRLWLDGNLVIDEWANGPMRPKLAKVFLRKDRPAALRLEYFQGRLARGLRFAWRTPSEQRDLQTHKPKFDNSVKTYLPQGAQWYDFWTGTFHSGGQWVTQRHTLDTFPLFVRAGSIVPIGPVLQYATEPSDDPYEIRIYGGADARFTIFEDDGETYAYESGRYATYDLVWNEARRVFTVSDRMGSFPAPARHRRFDVVLIEPGDESAGKSRLTKKSIDYQGTSVRVNFAR